MARREFEFKKVNEAMAWSGVQKLDSDERNVETLTRGRCGVLKRFTEWGHVAII